MGLHIKHSLYRCKCSPSLNKDIKYNDKNKELIYIIINVQYFLLRRNSKFCNIFKTVHLFIIIVKFANLE